MYRYPKKYDVIVVGGGHAGCEGALAAARMGALTLLITLNMDSIAQMSCNPSIGGPGKAHLVREIDALGGEMAVNIDRTHLHIRMLNTSKGPAVQALRAQADKKLYSQAMKFTLEQTANLEVKQEVVEDLWIDDARVRGVVCRSMIYEGLTVILTTGTFLRGLIHIGDVTFPGGRAGEFAAEALSESLMRAGLSLGRLKTGTPPRVDGRSVDYSSTVPQWPSDVPLTFSFRSPRELPRCQLPCYLTWTTLKTREIIQKNLHLSPLYSGKIRGVGPRYCPSIEDKIVKFSEKDQHQIFLEPEAWNTLEVYVQGFSTSLPAPVQIEMLRSIVGLHHVEMMRPGYAVEYDYAFPTQLWPSLESRIVRGLFCAGQINGTSGYEEAAAQGLMAGINATLWLRKKEPLIIKRSEGYIGVLLDDLVTRGTEDPYRMMTSRAEYRLLMRQDNADLRLTPLGHKVGLVPASRYQETREKERMIGEEIARLGMTRLSREGREKLQGRFGIEDYQGTLTELLRRPEVRYSDLLAVEESSPLPCEVTEQVEIEIKYEGYIERQRVQVGQVERLEEEEIPMDLDFVSLQALSREGREKLQKVRPSCVGQASRIPGVSPADISVLLVYLKRRTRVNTGEKKAFPPGGGHDASPPARARVGNPHSIPSICGGDEVPDP